MVWCQSSVSYEVLKLAILSQKHTHTYQQFARLETISSRGQTLGDLSQNKLFALRISTHFLQNCSPIISHPHRNPLSQHSCARKGSNTVSHRHSWTRWSLNCHITLECRLLSVYSQGYIIHSPLFFH